MKPRFTSPSDRSQSERSAQIDAVPVRVCDEVIVWRHGQSWTAGQVLAVEPRDAHHMERNGSVEIVQPGERV